MTPPMERFTTALADRYRLERELGQGGIAGRVTAVVAGVPQEPIGS
jgi:hypothetical protein